MNNINIKKRFFYIPKKMNKITITCQESGNTNWNLNIYSADNINSLIKSIAQRDSSVISTPSNKLYICRDAGEYQLTYTANGCVVIQNSSLSIGTGDYCYEVELTSSEATLSVTRYVNRP